MSARLASLLLAASASLLLAGCADNPYTVPTMPNVASGCVDSMATLHATAIPATLMKDGQPVPQPYVDFGKVSQCLHLPATAPEAVSMYAIGPARPLELKIKLLLSPRGTMPAEVALLDDQFHEVRNFAFSAFTHRTNEYTLPIFLNAADANIRYVLVTPDPHFVGTARQTHSSIGGAVPVAGVGYSFLIYTGREVNTTYPFTLGGRIAVSSTTEVSAPIVLPSDRQ